MSKKRSPGEGAGSRPSPRCSSGSSRWYEDLVVAIAVELQRRLVAERLDHRRREPADAEVGRRLGEPGQRRDVDGLELRGSGRAGSRRRA